MSGRHTMGAAHRLAARRRVMLQVERDFWRRGMEHVAGVDEVGVGPLAGPLVAAAVILPREVAVRGIDDSKRLGPPTRTRLAEEIRRCALAVGVGIVSVEEVDRLNVHRASAEAMRRAVLLLPTVPQQLLVDARVIPGVDLPQMSIIKGDARSYSIAAASIIAKVTRDALMRDLDAQYPAYGFGKHMGYGTRDHLLALERYGPSPVHRRSFLVVRQPRLPGF
jgi:ribonuclease HII